MSAAQKILNNDPTELELKVAQALTDLEKSNSDLKAPIRALQFKHAKEIATGNGKSAIVIFVPVPQLALFHKNQQNQAALTRELEKKFSDKHIIFLSERRVLPKPSRKRALQGQKRPRSRTLTAVHDAILEDLVFPTDITGKRCRFQAGGNRTYKVYLDPEHAAAIDYKIDSFQGVYSKLTGKNVVFEVKAEII